MSTRIVPLVLAALGALSCAGKLATDEIIIDPPPTRGSAGSGGGSGTSTGSGGGVGSVDTCVVSSPTSGPMHTCQGAGCHGGPMVSAGLNLDNENLTKNYKAKFVDMPNTGDPTGVAPACEQGAFKLIDSSSPMNSLLYQKLVAAGEPRRPPCGAKMPFVGQITQDEKACILRWIQSVIVASTP